jgi:LPXTG-motif cell wall-anchored protein
MKRLSGLIALLVLAVFPGMFCAAATAHQGNPDFRSEIDSVRPEALGQGLSIEIVNFDDHVRLVNKTGKEVIIKGYDGEPYARISPEGSVEVNLNSPAYYLNEDRFAEVDVPARADPKAKPDWKQIDDNSTFEWHDHRSHYMGQGTPPQVKDESEKTKVFDYRIPIEVGGKPAKIDGTLIWVGTGSKAPVIPFIILGLAIIAAIGFWISRKRRGGGAADGTLPEEEPSRAGEEKEAW